MRQLGIPVVISLGWKVNSGLFISSNGAGTVVRGWGWEERSPLAQAKVAVPRGTEVTP